MKNIYDVIFPSYDVICILYIFTITQELKNVMTLNFNHGYIIIRYF